MIRDDGKINWPLALAFVVSRAEQAKFEKTVAEVIANAEKGKVDAESITAMGKQIDDIRGKLVKKIDVILTDDYLEAKRFLNYLG